MDQDKLKDYRKSLVSKIENISKELKIHEQRKSDYEELSKVSSNFLNETAEYFRESVDSHLYKMSLEEHVRLERQINDALRQNQEDLLHEKRRLSQEVEETDNKLLDQERRNK